MQSTLINQIEKKFNENIEGLTDKMILEKATSVFTYYISKSDSSKRKIVSINSNSHLSKVQTYLIEDTFASYYFIDNVYGFLKGKSYFDYLRIHTSNDSNRYFLKLDIKNFFNTINTEKLTHNLLKDLTFNEVDRDKIYNFLFQAITYDDKLPQGFKTSPILSNIYFHRADLRIYKYCEKLGYQYSRYADDIIISAEEKRVTSNGTVHVVENILKDFDLKLNLKKKKISKNELALNGFVIGEEIRLSRKKLNEIIRILFILEHHNYDNVLNIINSDKYRNSSHSLVFYSLEYLLNYLSGYRSFLISSLHNIEFDSKLNSWNDQAIRLIDRIDKSLIQLYNFSIE